MIREPIEFEHSREGNQGNGINEPQMAFSAPTAARAWNEQQMRLDYVRQKDCLELMKNQAKYNQRLEFEKQSQAVKLCREVYKEFLGAEVYRNTEGVLIYVVADPEQKISRSKRLLNIAGYKPRLLVSEHPAKTILEIAWGEREIQKIFFSDAQEGIPTALFLRKLKSKGVVLLVSGRSEKTAAEALIAFTYREAPRVCIPFYHGWCLNEEGRWHYAGDEELTMQEVLENVR